MLRKLALAGVMALAFFGPAWADGSTSIYDPLTGIACSASAPCTWLGGSGGGGAITGPLGPATAPSAAVAVTDIGGSNPGNSAAFVKGTTAAMTGTTSTQLIAAVTSNKIYLTDIICTNSSATGTFVTVQDGSAGSTIYEGYAAASGGGFVISLKTPISNTSGNGVFVADVTTSANVICSGSGYSGT